jgi:DNA-binding GntR family transcriptional regulator
VSDVLRERHELEVVPTGWILAAEPADDSDAVHLDIVPGAPIVVLSGAQVNGHGRRIAHVVERIRADRVELVIAAPG